LVNLSLTCILSHVYFPKLNLLLDCNKEYILSVSFKLFSLPSSSQALTLMRLVCVPLMWSDQLGQSWCWRNVSVIPLILKVIQEQGQKIHLFLDGCQPYIVFFIL